MREKKKEDRMALSLDRKRDFFTSLDRAHRYDKNGRPISLSRIECNMAEIRERGAIHPLCAFA